MILTYVSRIDWKPYGLIQRLIYMIIIAIDFCSLISIIAHISLTQQDI